MNTAPCAHTGGAIAGGQVVFVRLGENNAEFCLVAAVTPRGQVRVQPFDRPGFIWGTERTVRAADVDDILTPAEVRKMQRGGSLPTVGGASA